MRICLVSTNIQQVPVDAWGGIECQVDGHARGLAELGHEVHVMTVGDTDSAGTCDVDGIRYHRLGKASARIASVTGKAASLAGFALRTHGLVSRLVPDVVHIHSRYPAYLILRFPSRRRDRWLTVYHAHNWKRAEDMSYPTLSLRRTAAALGARIDRTIARKVDHIIAISRFMKERIVATAGVDPEKVSVLTNMVDIEMFRPGGNSAEGKELLFVGRIAAEKGVHTLIEAMSRVVCAVPDAMLRIVGPAKGGSELGGYSRECRELVDRLGLRSRVRFEGEVPNHRLPDILSRARILVVPSLWGEPCGLVAIEALACGVPVICNRTGGLPELIDEGETGILTDPGDPDSLARAIVRGLTDDSLSRNASLFGPERVAARHARGRIRDELDRIYSKALTLRLQGNPSRTG